MTPEQARELTKIYDEAIQKLDELAAEKQRIIKHYIQELEQQKIKTLRESLSANQS